MELGRAYYITKALSFRPHFGVRGAWLKQKFHDFFSGSLNDVAEFKWFHGKNNYWGVGPRAGTSADAPLHNIGNQPVTMEDITANLRLDF